MCLSPIKIVNPAKYIALDKCQPLYLSVPCGHCSECQHIYRNVWRLRGYYECLGTFQKSSSNYVLMDTLTYRNGNLPHLSDWLSVPHELDFPCFNNWHIQTFMADLRSYLSYRGYNVANNLRYLVCCEYGSDIRYTRRPHYHVLFFVNCYLPWQVLSKAISTCWYHGRTDGVRYKGRAYVSNRCVIRDMTNGGRAVCSYVTKYFTKDFGFSKLVKRRLDALRRFDYNIYQSALPFVRPFHSQSKGFGYDSLLRLYSKESILLSLTLPCWSKQGFVRVSVPASLKRKICYDAVHNADGSVTFRLNEFGFRYKIASAERSIKCLATRYANHNDFNVSNWLLVARTVLFYNNRFLKGDESIDTIVRSSYNVDSGLRNYAAVDRSFIRKRVFSVGEYGSLRNGFRPPDYPLRYSDPKHLCYDSIVSLDGISSLCYFDDSATFVDDSMYSDLAKKGDSQLEVDKKLYHLKEVYKNLNLC